MIRNIPAFIALSIAFFCATVHAEGGCPPGQYPQQGQGWQTCVPIPASERANQGAQPIHVPSKWLEQWQAIATDTSKGILGTSTDKTTGQAAETAALSDCRAKGGGDCRVEISYANGCVAMAVGSSLLNTKGGANKQEAEQRAMAKCNEEDSKCHVYYSECSLPIEVPE